MYTLRQLRNLRNLSQQEVADAIGISRVTYNSYENNRSNPSNDVYAKLAEFYDVPVEVITGKVDLSKALKSSKFDYIEPKSVMIPIAGHVRAGYNGITDNDIEGYMYIEESVAIRFPNCYSINVIGNSMEPEIHNGDRVIVQPCSIVDSGDVAIVALNGDEATIKRVRIDENGVTIIPANPKYKPITYSPEEVKDLPVTICGRVVQVRHNYY